MSDTSVANISILLSNQQKEYIATLGADKQKQSLAVRALLNSVLTENFEDTSISQLLTDNKGKPFLKESNLHISLTHSGEYVGCAVSNCPVGIDIERIKPVKASVITRVCSEEELKNIQNETDFFTIWTFKEAYVKATGKTDSKFSDISFFDRNIKEQFYIISNEIDGYKFTVLEMS